MADSTVPATIDALVALWSTALTDVSVHDGPAVTSGYNDHLSVAYDGDNPEIVTTDLNPANIRGGNPDYNEVFFVSCTIATSSGGAVMSTRRNRAFEIFAACKAALREDMKLGGVVQSAWVADFALLQEPPDEHGNTGLSAGIRFRVRCKSRI